MNKNELIQFYKDLYFSELARKEKITDRAQILFGFIATGLTLLAYIMKVVDVNALTVLSITLIISSVLSLFAITYSALLLRKAFWGNTYEYISSPFEIEEYRSQLLQYQNQVNKESSALLLDTQLFENFLIDDLTKASSHNVKVNEARIKKMNHFYNSSILSVAFVFIAGFMFMMINLGNTHEQTTADKVKKVEPKEQIIAVEAPQNEKLSAELAKPKEIEEESNE
ncbi:MAG: hypothetical protein ACJAS1_002683 [Oleiphilaceae bacterium]|jgi:hypothetical protein